MTNENFPRVVFGQSDTALCPPVIDLRDHSEGCSHWPIIFCHVSFTANRRLLYVTRQLAVRTFLRAAHSGAQWPVKFCKDGNFVLFEKNHDKNRRKGDFGSKRNRPMNTDGDFYWRRKCQKNMGKRRFWYTSAVKLRPNRYYKR